MSLSAAAERVARLEKEAQSLKRVSEEVFRVQKQIDGEKAARESASGQLQSDLQQLLSELPTPFPVMLLLHHLSTSNLSHSSESGFSCEFMSEGSMCKD